MSPVAKIHSPSSPTTSAKPWPERPVARVARLRSPVRHQISARAIRPPSSGNAGTMLKTNSIALMKPSQPISASAGVVVKPSRVSATSVKRALLATAVPAARQSGEQRERHRRPGRRDLQLLARGLRLAAHLREAAEEPQVDAGDRDPQAARGQRVAELVQDQRGEVPERAGHGDQVGGRLRAPEQLVEVIREPVDQEEQHEEPADAHADADAEDAGELDVRAWRHT